MCIRDSDYSSYGEYTAKGLPARQEPMPQIEADYTVDDSAGRALYSFCLLYTSRCV